MNKSCPFCGSNKLKPYKQRKIARRFDKSTYHCYIACEECHTQGPRVLIHATPDEIRQGSEFEKQAFVKAYAAWNIRLGNK